MRFSGGCLVLALAVLGKSGCADRPSTPTPSPTPTTGKPNPTALDNLALVRSLEQASGRKTILVRIAGAARPDGSISTGTSWQYQFAEESGTTVKLYEWDALPTGELVFRGVVPELVRLDIVELGPFLAIDSPQAIQLGRGYGGQQFLDRYPQALVGTNYWFQGRLPTCQMVFFTQGDFCSALVIIHAQTGELLARDLSCLR
jgi:hypothetical protein